MALLGEKERCQNASSNGRERRGRGTDHEVFEFDILNDTSFSDPLRLYIREVSTLLDQVDEVRDLTDCLIA